MVYALDSWLRYNCPKASRHRRSAASELARQTSCRTITPETSRRQRSRTDYDWTEKFCLDGFYIKPSLAFRYAKINLATYVHSGGNLVGGTVLGQG